MNTKQVARKIILSDTRTSWEDQANSEVAAGKLEVMEKFFKPLPHPTGSRTTKDQRSKKVASWGGIKDKHYKEFISSSSTSSSPWSSESNFRTQARFSGYHAQASHSRSCNDLSMVKGRQNGDRRNVSVQQKHASHIKKDSREGSERLSPGIQKAGSTIKSHSGHARDVERNKKSEREDKHILKNGGRRVRSMEALAEKETRRREGKERRVTDEKQRFSRFLDEITVQVLSPKVLNSLGVKERQSVSNQEQWKSSSTDSSSSRGKNSQHNSAAGQQEVRRKGRTASATRAKAHVEAPGHRRSRDMSTSPDSASSSNWHRGEREEKNLSSSALTHQPSRTNHRQSQERKGNHFEHMVMEKKHNVMGGGLLKEKTQYTDKVQNSELVSAPNAKEPLTTSTTWWGETGGSVVSQQLQKNMEHITDPTRRMKDTFSAAQSHNQVQDMPSQPSPQHENLEQEKGSLNWKITELLDHLVQAQSTICALEKLNVSSLLHKLPADMLESIKVSNKSDDHNEGAKDFTALSVICSEASHLNIHSDNLQYTREQSKVEDQPVPRMTAFTPWSPKRQRSFNALHTLYTSTESECSLEDVLPTFKLLSPRFPNLGESFSDDRKDDGSNDICELREEQKIPGVSNPSLPYPSLLPTHRTPHRNLLARASSSESSGDDRQINWGEMPSQEAPLDYHSAQKILDTLLGLTTPADRANSENAEFTFDYVPKSGGHLHRSDIPPSNNPKNVIPRSDSKHLPSAMMDRKEIHSLERPSQPKSPLCSVHSNLSDDSNQRLHPIESKIPQFPNRGCLLPESFADMCPHLSSLGDVGFRPVAKSESSSQHKSEASLPPNPLPKPVPPVVSPSHHSIPFVLRSPSGSESIVGSWDGHNQCQEGARERKPRKARTVTFNTLNDSGPIQSQVTVRSKFMSNKDQGDHGQGQNQSSDSTLL